jgi:cysteine rich repeat protein
MKVFKVITLVALLAVALIMAAPAQAEHHGGPCRADVQRLCPDVEPGFGGFRDCLTEHASELSPACQERLSRIQAKMAAWRAACQDDVQKLCSDVAPGRGNIIRCLHENHDQLSESCQAQLAQHHRRHHHHGCDGPTPTPGTDSNNG